MAKLPPIRAIIFDMDGTLTVPVLDFDLIKAEIGIPGGTPVLEALEAMPPEQRGRADAILARHEADASERCQLSPGAADLIGHLTGRRIPIALLTRNSRVSVNAFCAKFAIDFDAIHTREDGPNKPNPEPVLRLCRTMGVSPAETLVVGDFLFDILSGQAAGCPTCLIHQGPRPPYADKADLVVQSLAELIAELE
ncbi:MAG: HAD family hydrolase [Phycisphaerae bacterium]|nr:HAD family hydrolase [Phycisphaerae bacterium]